MERRQVVKIGDAIYERFSNGTMVYVGRASYEDMLKYSSIGIRAGASMPPMPQTLKEKTYL